MEKQTKLYLYLVIGLLAIALGSCNINAKDKLQGTKWILYKYDDPEYSAKNNRSDTLDLGYGYMRYTFDGSFYPYKVSFMGDEISTNIEGLKYGEENFRIADIDHMDDSTLVLRFHVLGRMRQSPGYSLMYFSKIVD